MDYFFLKQEGLMDTKNKNEQVIYINLDDSGKLTRKEKISVYGGLLFFSKKEKDKFITQYRSIMLLYDERIIFCVIS